MKIVLNKPIRFLAFEWREHWEFDHPTVLLEPVFKYSPNGTSIEDIIEDAAIDIAIAIEEEKSIDSKMNSNDRREFRWRRWGIKKIKDAAASKLAGKDVEFGVGYTGVLEQWFVFKQAKNGEIEFIEYNTEDK